ncbi:amino acid/amide ABC transporter substrate-binding protein, HAAT family [Micromonospora viridifaciens]|uniref:Amino acid/amide ABC transporter substrate-binding protein, HAAT family n=1 Tax=Micromonospora viridifaciens TaxID=1881 RepID=A0A1C4ZW94_MICVI|nr:ABC transporter substrate-binding protein [Micromonospora viridifaciens]SCF37209.1 amino acid/amide ABC transporter substrate-binding protein, HAAT family [Micromonospora viridifaciens]
MATPALDSSLLTRRGVLAAAAGTLLLTACGEQQGQRSDEGPATSTADPGRHELVIGASLELTGRGAALGVLQQRAMEITVESLNLTGIPVGNLRRAVRLEIRDNRSDPREAARQATELTRRDQVHALVGGTSAETSMAIVEVAQNLQVPFVSLAAGDDIVLPLAQRTYIYKLTPDAGDVARRMARLINSLEVRRVVLLAADGLHGDSGVRAVRSALRDLDLELTRVVRLPASGRSFTSAARRAAAGGPDGVIVWGTAPDSGTAARELRRAGHRGPLFFDPGAVAEDTLIGSNAAAVEGAYAVHPACLAASTLTTTTTAELARRDFTYRYIQRHGSFSGFAPYGSDAVRLLAAAARAATSVDRGRLRAYLQTQVTEGISGGYAFAPIRHGGMERDSLGVYVVSQRAWTRYS